MAENGGHVTDRLAVARTVANLLIGLSALGGATYLGAVGRLDAAAVVAVYTAALTLAGTGAIRSANGRRNGGG